MLLSNKFQWLAFLSLALICAGLRNGASAQELTKVGTVEGITEYKMANGLQVLLLPDPSEAKVTVNITILVGSRHEGLGETGMAHLLEHMVFKGTPTFPNVPKSLSEHGADFNGTTWLDRTNYFETMPASNDNLEFGIQLEADRLVNSNVKREDLVSEMTVVRNEFEMGENNPEAILSQRMNAVAYEWHNYGKSTIGNRSDIERVPVENLQQFYKKYYQPDNAVLIVAGKFDEKKALELIGKYFGKLKKPTRVLPKTYSEEPAQDGERIAVLRRVGKVGAAGLLYHIPAFVHPDYPVIELLEDVLSRDSGRLHKALIDTKLATTLNGTSYGLHDPGYLEEFCKCTPQNVDKVLDTMVNVVEGIAQQPITEEELKISKQRFTKFNEQLVSKTSNFAIRLSEAAACGDYRLFFLHRDRAEQVTLEDINRVAKTYLIRSNRTMGKYYPTAKPERAKIPATPEIATVLKDYKGRAAMTLGEAFIPTPENIEKRVVRGQIDSIKTAFITKKTKGEVVDLHLNLRFGNEETLKGKNKSIDLLGDLLMRGTATKTRKQIQDELDALGSNLSVGADLGLLTVSIHSKKSKLLPTLAILEDVLRHPGFNVEEFELLKNEYRERLTKGKTDPQALAMREMRRRLNPFPKDNIRYTPTVDEELERLDSTTLESLKEIYSQFSAQTGELAIVGDFEPEVVQPAIKKLILGWTTTVAYKRVERPAVKDILSGKEVINTPDKENAVYLAGLSFPMTDSDPQYPAMRIGNFILGEAPLASRISVRVRGEKGLSYGAGSFTSSSPKDKNSSFTMYAITNPNNMGKVNATIAEELNKFLKEGLSLDELDKGKASLLESMKLQHADDNVLANDLANGLFLGRTFDYYKNLEKQIQDVKAEEVQKAFQENVKPERLIIIEAGDFKKK